LTGPKGPGKSNIWAEDRLDRLLPSACFVQGAGELLDLIVFYTMTPELMYRLREVCHENFDH
jgi:hypothetical protein